MFWMHYSSLQNCGSVSHTSVVKCFQNCGFNWNTAKAGEDATELGTAKDGWGQLRAGASFQEYISCDYNAVNMWSTGRIMMVGQNGRKSTPPATFLSALESTKHVRKWLMKYDVDDMPLADLRIIVLSSAEGKDAANLL